MKSLIEPTSCLREFVSQYVVVESETMPEYPVVATTDVTLGFHLGERCRLFDHRLDLFEAVPPTTVVGPQTQRWVVVQLTRGYSGLFVKFAPGGFDRLFGINVSELSDHGYSAADVLGPEVVALRDEIEEASAATAKIGAVEAFLLTRAVAARREGATHRAARTLKASRGTAELDRLVEACGVSDRHFRRQFLARLGMSPKHYAKVVRFTYALRLKGHRPWLSWAEVSQEAGYYDQMHLVKDCKALGAAPPTGLAHLVSSPMLPIADEPLAVADRESVPDGSSARDVDL